MVISKTKDYRKCERREIFFGMPFLPLFFFLILIIVLLIVASKPVTDLTSGFETDYAKEKYDASLPITGAVVSGINLTKINYFTNEYLQGLFDLRFYPQDLIPAASNVSFIISGIKCNHFYVCSDESLVQWEIYNLSSGRCQNVTQWQYGPWYDVCGESYTIYPNSQNSMDCTSLGGKCCSPGYGIGYFYPNLNCSNKECWDDCSTNSTHLLTTIVGKSSTPNKGNYSYGTFNNVNGSEPQGQGWGFGYCNETASGAFIYPEISGYAIYFPDITGNAIVPAGGVPSPDLVIEKVIIKSGAVAEPKVYAKIENRGMASANNFVVVACWYSMPSLFPECNEFGQLVSVPPNCKNVTLSLRPGSSYDFEINNLNQIINQNLYVKADYCEKVNESSENNNQIIRYVGCKNPDDGLDEIYIKSNCSDINGKHEDRCSDELPNVLNEMKCSETVPRSLSYCIEEQVSCENGCNDGACIQVQQPWCNDSDGGYNLFVAGFCSDSSGNTGFDKCINNYIIEEYSCLEGIVLSCVSSSINCSEAIGPGSRCVNEACTQQPEMPDLIVEKIERTADGKKVLVWIKNIGNGMAIAPFNISLNITGEVNAFEIVSFNSNLSQGNNGSISSGTSIEGKVVFVSAFVDWPSPGVVEESNENNNKLNVYLSPYFCTNWNNVYSVPLGSGGLNLKAPNYEGVYYLNVSIYYSSVEMSRYSSIFKATKPVIYYYKGCSDNRCITKSSTTPKNDSCDSDSDCVGPGFCDENWQFKDLTGCINKQRKLECYDTKNCGTIDELPSGCIYDSVFGKYFKTESCCEPSWQCDAWSACYEHQGTSVQSMSCQDLNRCDPQNSSYIQLRDCCVEDWQCNWGPCVNGEQKLMCNDIAGCGTEFMKPKEETRACGKVVIAWWIWLIIIIVVLAITLVVLFATHVIKLPKAKKVKEESVEKAKPEEARLKESLELNNYIKSALAAGMSKEEIKKKLVEAGWSDDVVDKALAKV